MGTVEGGGGQMRARSAQTRRIGVIALVATLALVVGAATAAGDRVRASNYSFKPRTVTIQKGQSVTWKRVEGRHTVTLRDGSFDKVLSKSHPRRSLSFDQPGTFRYYCRFHRSLGMKGKVVVQ
jgi:plastocyanin